MDIPCGVSIQRLFDSSNLEEELESEAALTRLVTGLWFSSENVAGTSKPAICMTRLQKAFNGDQPAHREKNQN